MSSSEDEARVAAVIEQLKAGVLQRRAERATAGGAASEARFRLLEMQRHEYVRQPVPVSPRPLLGRFLVFFRKGIYHLLLKWHARGVGDQQNSFNQATVRLLDELVSSHETWGRELARLTQRVAELERQVAPAQPSLPSAEAPDA